MTEFEMAENDDTKPPVGEQKKNTPAMALALDRLRMNPEATYQDIKDAATLAGIQVPPIVFGRARSLLGLAPMKPPRPKKKFVEEEIITFAPRAAAPAARPEPELAPETDEDEGALRKTRARRGPSDSFSALNLEGLVASVRALEEERDALRDALDQIAEILRRLE